MEGVSGETTPGDFARDLALKGRSAWHIRKELKKRGWSGEVSALQMDQIMTEARLARSFLDPIGKLWPRVLGAVALTTGVGWKLAVHGYFRAGGNAGGFWSVIFSESGGGRWSPDGYCDAAIILGLILLIKPQWGRERID